MLSAFCISIVEWAEQGYVHWIPQFKFGTMMISGENSSSKQTHSSVFDYLISNLAFSHLLWLLWFQSAYFGLLPQILFLYLYILINSKFSKLVYYNIAHYSNNIISWACVAQNAN